MSSILFIDTSNSQKITVGIETRAKKVEKVASAKHASAQMVLPLIEELVKEQKIKLPDITQIQVNTGPGSFTGLRVGISVAQMLGTLLSIPVNKSPHGRPILPTYE